MASIWINIREGLKFANVNAARKFKIPMPRLSEKHALFQSRMVKIYTLI